MAATKATITQQYQNNSATPTSVTIPNVETEVVGGQVVARRDIVNPGVINP